MPVAVPAAAGLSGMPDMGMFSGLATVDDCGDDVDCVYEKVPPYRLLLTSLPHLWSTFLISSE